MTNLLFDYDGTLHDTLRIYAPAFRKAQRYLVDKGLAEVREWRNEETGVWLGWSSRDMWNSFRPDLPEAEKETCSRIIGEEMLSAIKEGRAQLYDGALDTLRQLKKDGYRLLFLSNCKKIYMDENVRQFSLAQFFSAFYCAEQYDFAPKHDIFRDIAKSYDGGYVVIGDRHADSRIAQVHGLPFIGCRYGYGTPEELCGATCLVDTPYEIVTAVRHLSETEAC